MFAVQMAYYLLIIIGIIIIIFYRNYLRAVRLAFILPGPPALPLLGNVLLINDTRKLVNLANNAHHTYGRFIKCWIAIIPFFLVTDPCDLQVILSSSKSSEKNMFYTLMHTFLGEGLITNNGQIWRQHRRLIQPYFHINILKNFVDIFLRHSNVLVAELNDKPDVNVISFVNKCILNILHEAVLGVSVDNTRNSPFRTGKMLIPYRLVRPWLLLDWTFKFTKFAEYEMTQKKNLQNYTRKVLQMKRKTDLTKCTNPETLLEMLMEISGNHPEFTDDDIINESCTFMLAGQDSVGAAVVFALHSLAKYQNIQEIVRRELNSIFEGSNRSPNFDDLTNMKYLEQCIKETLRLYPSVPLISRKLTEDVVLDKYTFPRGSNIFISPFLSHRLPDVFSEPFKFDPDRFSVENQHKIHPFAYIPFNAGPRNCIGYKFALLEMKMLISEILRNYQISLTAGHEELELSYRITLRAKGGVWLRLTKINRQ